VARRVVVILLVGLLVGLGCYSISQARDESARTADCISSGMTTNC
jgi:hypothetical protein